MMQPFISFVATSRNDDHGGDVLRRTQSFVNGLALQAERHGVSTELVLVDWNPPGARAPLADVLDWPKGTKHFTARVVTTPLGVHARIRHSEKLAMFQMIAKNVGIRRANGRYIVATNIDIVFSDELFRYLRPENLKPGVLYRSDRWDIPNEIQLEPDFDALLRRARSSPIRKNMADGTYVLKDGKFKNSTQDRIDWMILNQIEDAVSRARAFIVDKNKPDLAVGLLEEIRSKIIPQSRLNYKIVPLHTNGCGDFTLMAREDWFRLRGYPEWHIFSWAIDSVFIYQAHYNGHPIVELPGDHTHYHIEHDNGSGWTPEGAQTLWTRLDQRCIPYLKYDETMEIFHELRERGAAGEYVVYNGLDWGFAHDDLPDEIVASEAAPARSVRARNEGKLKEIFEPDGGWPHIDCAVARAYKPVPEARHTIIGLGDSATLRFKTHGAAWAYAAGFDLRPELARGGEWWLRFRVKVLSGAISAGVLNEDQTKFLSQSAELTPGEEREEYLYIRDGAKVSSLMFRNSSKNVASEAEISSLTLFSLRRADGSDPSVESTNAIAREAAVEHARPRVPPLAPPPPRVRANFERLSLQGIEAIADGASVNLMGEGAWLGLETVDEGLAIRIPIPSRPVGSQSLVRVQLGVEEGAVDIIVVGQEGSRPLSNSPIFRRNGAHSVTLDVDGAYALIVRNRHAAPSRAMISSLEISAEEAFDFVAQVDPSAVYETSPEAKIVRSRSSVAVRTPSARGAYGAGWDLRLAFDGGGPRNLVVKLRAVEGSVRIGVLDIAQSKWITLSEPVESGQRRAVSLDVPKSEDASVLILVNDADFPSSAEVETVTMSAPSRFLERVARHVPYLKPSPTTLARLRLHRAWESPNFVMLRKAAPSSLRQAWRRLYGSIKM